MAGSQESGRAPIWSVVAVIVAIVTGPVCVRQDSTPGAPSEQRCVSTVRRPAGLLLAGSGTNLSLVSRIVERYREANPASHVRLLGSIGSGGAGRAVVDGAIDLGLSSRPLSADERPLGLRTTPLARVPITVAAHPSVQTHALTRQRLIQIYRGEIDHWADGSEIVPLLREPGDSSRRMFTQTLPGFEAAMADAFGERRGRVCYTDAEMRDALLEVPGALGFLDLGTIRLERLPLRLLSLDGIEPTPDAVLTGRYPHVKPLSWLTLGPPAGEVARLIEFAGSAAVDDLFAGGGYLPPDPERP